MSWLLKIFIGLLGAVSVVGGYFEQNAAAAYSALMTTGAMMASGDQSTMQTIAMAMYVVGGILLAVAIFSPLPQKTLADYIHQR